MSYQLPTTSPTALNKNKELLYFSKVVSACAAGFVSGALGLVHIQGFILMAIVYVIVTLGLYVRIQLLNGHFFDSTSTILLEALLPFIMVFILYIIITNLIVICICLDSCLLTRFHLLIVQHSSYEVYKNCEIK
ncbi:ER membrane protein complex subunit 6 [Entamoeba marina]